MLNKKDPLVDAVQQVMQNNQAERAAVKAVNEKFGIQDRRVLPRERQGEWDAAYQSMLAEGTDPSKYSPKQKQLAAVAGDKRVIDGPDLDAARKGGASHIKEAEKMKGDDPCWKNYKMVGMKKGKGGKPVPNCVPVSEEGDPSKAIRGDVVTGGSSVTTVPSKPSSVTPADQSALKKKIQAIKEAKKAMCEDNLDEKAPPGREDQVKALKKKFPKGSGSPFAIAWSSYKKKKKIDEGFNNRHDSSITASDENQVVAELYAVPGTPAGNAYEKALSTNRGKPALPLQSNQKMPFRDRGIRRPVAPIRKVAKAVPALDPNRDVALDNPTTQSPMARATNSNIGGAGGGNYAAARKSSTVSNGNSRLASSVGSSMSAKDPKISNALSAKMRQTAGQRQGASVPSKTTSIADKPKMTQASTTTQPDYDKMSFKQAFASARQQAGGASGKFKYKGKEYQTNIKGKGTSSKPQEKYQASSKLKAVVPASQTQTTTSVTGGQGIAGYSSTSTAKKSIPAAIPARPEMASAAKDAGQMAVDRMKRRSSLASNKIDTQWQKGPDTSFNARNNYGASKPPSVQTDIRSTSNPERVANPTFVPQRPENRKSIEVRQDIESSINSNKKSSSTFGGPK